MKYKSKIINMINISLLLITILLFKPVIAATEEIKAQIKEPEQAVNLKIGVIKNNTLENSLYFQNIKKQWEKEFNPRGEKLQAKQREFESKKDLFQRDRAILSDKERIAKERELTKLQQEVQHMYESLDTEVKSKQQEDLVAFNKFVDQIVANLAKKEKYDLILSDQAVLYNVDHLDCSSKVIAALDAQFKAKK